MTVSNRVGLAFDSRQSREVRRRHEPLNDRAASVERVSFDAEAAHRYEVRGNLHPGSKTLGSQLARGFEFGFGSAQWAAWAVDEDTGRIVAGQAPN